MSLPEKLPCNNCPHGSVCCSWGTRLTNEEAQKIGSIHGRDKVYFDPDDGYYRTRVKNNKCVFLKNNRCTIYNKPYYPRICSGFPWKNGITGGKYEYNLSICPELTDTKGD